VRVIVERCAGLDVHKRSVTACVRFPGDTRRETRIRTFKTFTGDLVRLREWLAEHRVTTVVMESTGVFWRPVWRVLEGHDCDLILANARHVKQVPGRKTDVKDAQWLCELWWRPVSCPHRRSAGCGT
jgi:transposase